MSELTENTCSVSISIFQVFVYLPGASLFRVFLVVQHFTYWMMSLSVGCCNLHSQCTLVQESSLHLVLGHLNGCLFTVLNFMLSVELFHRPYITHVLTILSLGLL
jgi:hypothetical protein